MGKNSKDRVIRVPLRMYLQVFIAQGIPKHDTLSKKLKEVSAIYRIKKFPFAAHRPLTGSDIATHNATLSVKATPLRHHLTANQRRCKQTIGDAVFPSIICM